MTDLIFFDTDCLSAFLWINREDLLIKLFSGKIIIPKPVYDEISYPTVKHLRLKVDGLLFDGSAKIETIITDSEAFDLYYQLTVLPEKGHIIIAKESYSLWQMMIAKHRKLGALSFSDFI